MNVWWFNFILGLIFVYRSLALSHQSLAFRTRQFAPLYSRKNCKFDTNEKKTKVKVTKVKFVFFQRDKSMILGQKLEILSFFVFQQKKRPNKVFCELLDSKLAILNSKNIHLKKAKIWHFSKGVRLWFLVKNWTFCPFFH